MSLTVAEALQAERRRNAGRMLDVADVLSALGLPADALVSNLRFGVSREPGPVVKLPTTGEYVCRCGRRFALTCP